MSAYGAIARPSGASRAQLRPRSYVLPARSVLTVFPSRRESVDDELVAYLARVFNTVVEEGRTYPQKEQLTRDEFVRLCSFPPRAMSGRADGDRLLGNQANYFFSKFIARTRQSRGLMWSH